MHERYSSCALGESNFALRKVAGWGSHRWRGARTVVGQRAEMEIYVTREGQRAGPYSLEEVNRQLAAGTLSPVDQAWSEGSPGWKPVLSFSGVIMPGGASSTALPLGTATVSRLGAIRYAGFWVRAMAFLFDCVVLVIPAAIIQIAIAPRPDDPAFGQSALRLIIVVALGLIYFPALWSSPLQATVGQRLCRLKVVDAITRGRISFSRAVGRCLVLWLGLAMFLIGVIMIAFTERKRGLHDLVAGTCVIKDQPADEVVLGL
jgi:uncharacterized RDD family membrane protein YckC